MSVITLCEMAIQDAQRVENHFANGQFHCKGPKMVALAHARWSIRTLSGARVHPSIWPREIEETDT